MVWDVLELSQLFMRNDRSSKASSPQSSIPKTKLEIQHRNVLWGWIGWLLQSTNINTECQFAAPLCRQQRESEVRWRNEVLSLDCFQSATSAFAIQSWGRTPHSATPPYHSGILAAARFPLSNQKGSKLKSSLAQGVNETLLGRAGFEASCCHISEGKQRDILQLRVYMDSKFILALGGPAFSAPSPS